MTDDTRFQHLVGLVVARVRITRGDVVDIATDVAVSEAAADVATTRWAEFLAAVRAALDEPIAVDVVEAAVFDDAPDADLEGAIDDEWWAAAMDDADVDMTEIEEA